MPLKNQSDLSPDLPLSFAGFSQKSLDLPFLFCEQGVFSFGEMREKGRAELKKLAARADLGKFSALAFSACPSVERIALLLACFDSGIPAVLLHPRCSEAEHNDFLSLFAQRDFLQKGIYGIVDSGLQEFPQVELEKIAILLATSGTTGKPKAVCLSKRAFVASFAAHCEIYPWQENDRWLLCMPFAHIGGLSVLTRCFLAKKSVVLFQKPSFSPSDFVDCVQKNSVTLVSLVPTMLARLVAEKIHAPKSLRLVLLGGGACHEKLWLEAKKLGWKIATTYGMSETCSQIATDHLIIQNEIKEELNYNKYHKEQGGQSPLTLRNPKIQTLRNLETSKTSSCGRLFVLPGIKIKTSAEQEICVRGKILFSGYFQNGKLVLGIDREGWFKTRDIGEILPNGEIRLCGRKQDIIISGGENIFPTEVEALLNNLPHIWRCCVFGVADKIWGEAVAAVVVTDFPQVVLQEISQIPMAGFKKPKFVAFCSDLELPTKINRQKLAKQFQDKLVAIP